MACQSHAGREAVRGSRPHEGQPVGAPCLEIHACNHHLPRRRTGAASLRTLHTFGSLARYRTNADGGGDAAGVFAREYAKRYSDVVPPGGGSNTQACPGFSAKVLRVRYAGISNKFVWREL